MAELIKKKKKSVQKPSHSYFAVRSQNEIYYQMASIFKQAGKNDDILVEKILFTSLAGREYEIPQMN